MAAGASSSGNGAGGGEPYVTRKLIMGKDKITGDEDFTIIDEWLKELYTDIEIIMPRAKIRMKKDEKKTSKRTIDDQAMLIAQTNQN